MSDFALQWLDGEEPDLIFQDGDLVLDDSLFPAVAVSLFTDARALDADPIPDGTDNRRGFWGDSLVDDGQQMGSRLWLLDRSKTLAGDLQAARGYDLECLQWLLDSGEALAIEAKVTEPIRGAMQHEISITEPKTGDMNVISVIGPGVQPL